MEAGPSDHPTLSPANRLVGPSRGFAPAAALVLAAAVLAAWSNSFRAPFLYDDIPNIVTSPSIRHLWPIWEVLFPPAGSLHGARPLFNLSLALNYAVSGLAPWSYHLFNVFAHALASVALFGLVRRSLALPSMGERFNKNAGALALFTALVWALHPLNTEAVTYVSERTETLMALFLFLSAWLAVRGWESARPSGWHALAVFAFLAGVGAKETMGVLPLVMLAYEWVFFGRGPVRALRASPLLYGGWALGLGFLGVLLFLKDPGSVIPFAPVSSLDYLATQSRVILHYLRLALWPSGLCFNYHWPVLTPREALPSLAVLGALFALSLRLLVKRRPLGFLGVWFFLTLAPASSFIPLAFTARDRRMILPMAALAVLAVAGSWSLGRRFSEKRGLGLGGAVLVACLAVSLGAATWVRNLDYASATSIWRDTVEKAPENYRAWVALGQAFQAERNREEARRAADKALALRPDLALAWVLSGSLYWDENRAAEAEQAWLMALEREPEHFAQANLSTVYLSQGRFDEAIRRAEAALARRPDYYPARMNLGMALAGEARLGEAEEILAGLVRTHPRAETFFGMGRVLDLQGRPGEAAAWYARALEAQPAHQEARLGLATVLSRQGRLREAVALYREVLEQSPDRPDVLVNLGRVFALLGRVPEAREEFQKALDLDPGNPVALSGLEGLDAGGP